MLAEPDATSNHPDREALYRTADAYSGLGEDEELLASAMPGKLAKIEHWQNSRMYYERSLSFWSKVERPRLVSPEGNECIPPAVVSQDLARVSAMLRHTQAAGKTREETAARSTTP